ncbi:MAG TPA: tetratricopeptide repeat protein [Candidatus Acidoferrales bacterium]|jgi:tetratricopeptide (TPR) repeat protein|nr:tetratricopeptide repeat protein [Candidatus Acidoferrales bacterium]
MRSLLPNSGISFGAILLAAALLLPVTSVAQAPPRPANDSLTQVNAGQATHDFDEKDLDQNLGDPKEDSAYHAFQKVPAADADKKIKLGQAFVNKYPKDRYTQTIYDEVAQVYYAKQDLNDFYAWTDKGLSVFPDDVSLLTLTGWVIPRGYKPDDPDGDKRLDKAEAEEKHAMQLIDGLQKPGAMSEQSFSQYKAGETAVVHSALGLIYFRREQYDQSAKEMQESMTGEASPDPTDLLVLGADFQNLSRFKEAADAFNRCAQVPGNFQATCKQQADNSLKMAQDSK